MSFALRTADLHPPRRRPSQDAEQLNLGSNFAAECSYNIFRWCWSSCERLRVGLAGLQKELGSTLNCCSSANGQNLL